MKCNAWNIGDKELTVIQLNNVYLVYIGLHASQYNTKTLKPGYLEALLQEYRDGIIANSVLWDTFTGVSIGSKPVSYPTATCVGPNGVGA